MLKIQISFLIGVLVGGVLPSMYLFLHYTAKEEKIK